MLRLSRFSPSTPLQPFAGQRTFSMKPGLTWFKVISISFLLLALIPMGIVARLAALDARPRHTWGELEMHNGGWFLTGQMQFGGERRSFHHYWTNIANGQHLGKSLQLGNYLECGTSHDWLWVLKRDRFNTNTVLEIASRFTDELPKKLEIPIDELGTIGRDKHHRYVSNHVQALVELDRIDLTDLQTLDVIDSLPLSPSTMRTIRPCMYESNRFLLVDDTRSTGGIGSVFKLIELRDRKLVELAEWRDIGQYSFRSQNEELIVSLMADGTTIETRSARSGLVLTSVPIQPNPAYQLPLGSISGTYPLRSWLKLGVPVDVFTGKSLTVPAGFELVERDGRRGRSIAWNKVRSARENRECVVLDEASGDEIVRFSIGKSILQSAILEDENHLVLADYGNRIAFYDLDTGKLVRSTDPFLWSDQANLLLLIGFGIWCILWLWISSSTHSHAWLDIVLIHGLILVYVCFRSQCVDSFGGMQGASLGVAYSAIGCPIVLASIWLGLGPARILQRVSLWIVCLAICMYLLAMSISLNDRLIFVIAVFCTVAFATTAVFLVIGTCGVRVGISEDCKLKQSGRHIHIRLVDIFLITSAIAFLLTTLLAIPAGRWSGATTMLIRGSIGMSIFFVALAVPLSGVVLWVSMSNRNFLARWTILSFVGTALAIGCLYIGGSPFMGVFASIWSLPLLLLFSLYAYRFRGWRFISRQLPTQAEQESTSVTSMLANSG